MNSMLFFFSELVRMVVRLLGFLMVGLEVM